MYSESDKPNDGYWYNESLKCLFSEIKGIEMYTHYFIQFENQNLKHKTFTTLVYGDFGKAPTEFIKITGKESYNLKMTSDRSEVFGIVKNEHEIYFLGLTNEIEVMKWKNVNEMNELKEIREDAQIPSIPYSIDLIKKDRKLVWISGPPGSGKSTSAQEIAKSYGYIYYEGDCFSLFCNPFLNLNSKVNIFPENRNNSEINSDILKYGET